uniref:Peptidase S1 domain-containing protein n=1 Tax=Timema cristinae TaxID=61476 RepID=A0A7R9H1M5_TIMCR|nr:unnamed protein product [Timema cristinae]
MFIHVEDKGFGSHSVTSYLVKVTAYPLKVNVNTTCGSVPAFAERVENHLGNTTLSIPDRESNLDLPVIGTLFYCESSALDHAATQAGGKKSLFSLTISFMFCYFSLLRANKDELMVVLGMHDRVQMEEGTEKFVKIDSLIIHESFTSDYLHDTDDIGLVKLKEPIVWDETIQPICLPKPGSDYRGKLGMVTGWGRTAQNGNPARYLRRAGVKIVHEDRCKNTTIGDHIRETMLCAYEYNTDACQGDSGGPLGYETKTGMVEQIGVVSWGIGCARPGIPGIYTKLTEYLDWIKAHTKDSWYCEKRDLYTILDEYKHTHCKEPKRNAQVRRLLDSEGTYQTVSLNGYSDLDRRPILEDLILYKNATTEVMDWSKHDLVSNDRNFACVHGSNCLHWVHPRQISPRKVVALHNSFQLLKHSCVVSLLEVAYGAVRTSRPSGIGTNGSDSRIV